MLIDCAKEKDMTDFNFDSIYNACTNNLKINTQKISMIDRKEGTQFDLNLNDFQIKKGLTFINLNSASFSSGTSRTILNGVNARCKKSIDTDLVELSQVLSDCISDGDFSIQSIISTDSTENDQNSDARSIILTGRNGIVKIQATVQFLGMTHNVSITAKVDVTKGENKMDMTITETRLPFGIGSVKLLMFFLKKYVVSKDIQVSRNTVTITL
jgi:hypothetical protein